MLGSEGVVGIFFYSKSMVDGCGYMEVARDFS
jgi:hypothetical protein